MNFEGIIALLKGKKKPERTAPAAPDPAIEFSHSENASLFTRLKEDSKVADPEKNPVWVKGGYEVRSHPDLIDILYGLVIDSGVRKGYAYGRPVMANQNGLIFAYAGGTHYISFKLREDKFDGARQDGGLFDPCGKDWIEFRVGGRVGSSSDWQDAMRRWARISYDDSLGIE